MAELTSQPISIQSLYSWYRENKLYVNRRYQRKLVWTLIEKQKLIESILNKYPIPAILVAEREGESGTYEIIDGLQRLHSIMSFIETCYPSIECKYFALKFFPSAQSRADQHLFIPTETNQLLEQSEVADFLDYTLALSIMRNASEDEVNDVFGRINTYGHQLSDQERRQAGIKNEFSTMVRNIACTIRGDASADVLRLDLMPSISIDLPKTKHGYEVQADEVVWVAQGILRSTDLRDSMDEQCIADISASVIGGSLIERSKETLDDIYTPGTILGDQILNALEVYGSEKFTHEFKYCFDEILKVCSSGSTKDKLRDIIFANKSTNPFPSVFAILIIAFHELIVKEGKKITDYNSLKGAITKIDQRLIIGRKATSSDERRKNIDTVKGLISDFFVEADIGKEIYGSHATTDIDALIRRSEIELSNYELKQGILSLNTPRNIAMDLVERIVHTICAIANNGHASPGKLIIGVSDDESDAEKIKNLDGIGPIKIGRRFVVGVNREAKALNISLEDYVSKWKSWIKSSELNDDLKESVLSNIDFNSYFDLGVIVITIPPQRNLSYVGEKVYWRNCDSTELVTQPRHIAELARRF